MNVLSVFDVLGLDPEDFSWRDVIVCRGQDTELFYSRYEKSNRVAQLVDQMCLSCPVRKQCLEAGIENQEWGVWGGIFLVNGKPDEARNSHKTEDIWDQIREGILGE